MFDKKVNLLVLVILDGWGIADAGPGNAVTKAKTPNMDSYFHSYPHTQLAASGEEVGLPKGVDGNSETGHLNLGAGKVVYQDLVRINKAIKDGSFFTNPAFLRAVEHVRKNHSQLHLLGLIGGGAVHSHNEHLYALLKLAKEQNLKEVVIHLFTDGRDSPPKSAASNIVQLEEKIKEFQLGRVASLMGRYWSMDRDTRWSRTKQAYEALTEGKGRQAVSPQEAVKQAYEAGETDEFISPTVIIDKEGKPKGLIKDKDAVVFVNFRIDRPRQLTKAFVLKDFKEKGLKTSFNPYNEIKTNNQKSQEPPFKRKLFFDDLFFVTMTEYERGLPVDSIAFPSLKIVMPLARVLSLKDYRQLHLAETEKERFVTYYFDGYREKPHPGEEWLTIPSPKVATYDLKPEMSAFEITEKAIERINSRYYKFILINFANPDMVGHTGQLSACVKALEAVDHCLGRIVRSVLSLNEVVIVTADHGNAEELIDPQTQGIDTKHSTNPVPFILIAKNHFSRLQLTKGKLADVAPTILKVLKIPQPSQMTGRSLI